jgi:hypothetical protein
MKWILISHPSAAVRVFNLIEGDTILEVMRYNPSQQSARISCQGRQRLFFIEQSGFRNNHLIFKNEYGFATGKFFFDNRLNPGGTIEIEEKKLHYTLISNPAQELVIYEQDSLKPLAACSLKTAGDGQVAVPYNNNKETIHEYACLLLGLCWYSLFKPAAKETSIDYNAAFALA